MLGELLGPDIQEMLDNKRLPQLREALVDLPPYDIAEIIDDLQSEQRALVFRVLPRELATDVFETMSSINQQLLLESLSQEQTRRIIEAMDPDNRTAFLEELPARVTRKLLRLLSAEERQIARSLLAYPEDSVGRLMTPDYIELRPEMTASQAIEHIRQVGMDRETVYVCYVTRPGHVLEGVVSLRRLVISSPDATVEELMDTPQAVAYTNQDQEEAAALLGDYDLLALPVVDRENRLVGIITVDDMLDVLTEEATEDMQLMAGVLPEAEHSYLDQRILGITWRRGFPLLGLVFGQFIAGLVMGGFHEQLNTIIALAFFVPMVMATGGGTGIQTATLIVRALSMGDMELRDAWKVWLREMLVCLMLALVLGAAGAALGFTLVNGMMDGGQLGMAAISNLAPKIAITIACTLFLVMLLSVTAGVLLPVLFQVLHLDPAVMTSPFLTTTVDIAGLLIYFQVARTVFNI